MASTGTGCAPYHVCSVMLDGNVTLICALAIHVLAEMRPTNVSLVEDDCVSQANVGHLVSSGAYGSKYWSMLHVREHEPSDSAS